MVGPGTENKLRWRKMALEKRACSKPELYSDFTVSTELQHSGLDSLPSGGLFVFV